MSTRSWTRQQLEDAAASSVSINETTKKLGLNPRWSGNWSTVKKWLRVYEIDITHFKGKSHCKGRKFPNRGKPLDELLVKDSPALLVSGLKKRLLAQGLLPLVCALCENPGKWRGQPLVLRIDHINGVNNDHRIENLRLLCPNCDSQLPTYCGRNAGRTKEKTS